jgi:hypothetical protein
MTKAMNRVIGGLFVVASLGVASAASASPKGDIAADWFSGSHATASQKHSVTDPAVSVSRNGAGRTRVAAGTGATKAKTGGTQERTNTSRAAASPRLTHHR